MRKVTWRRFDQSAKQLVVGQTTTVCVRWTVLQWVGRQPVTWSWYLVMSRPMTQATTRVPHATPSASMRRSLYSPSSVHTPWDSHTFSVVDMPSVLWHCRLGVRKSIRPVKLSDEVWLSVWSEVQIVCIWSSWCHCIPKPHNLLPHLNPDWFYLSGVGLPGLYWKRGR